MDQANDVKAITTRGCCGAPASWHTDALGNPHTHQVIQARMDETTQQLLLP